MCARVILHYDRWLASPTAGARAVNVLGPEGTLRCTQLAHAVGGMFDVQAQASRERRRRRIWRGCPSECNWIPHYDGRLASPTAGARAINVLGPEGTLRCTQLAQAVGGMFDVQAQASRERRRRRIWRGCPSECNWIPP